MPNERKRQSVALLKDKFERAQGMVFTEFRGLSANEMAELRRELRRHGVEYRVIKNRLAKLAAEQVQLEIDPFLQGPTGICFGFEDPVVPFKVAHDLSKRFNRYKLVGGLFEGRPVGAEEVGRLANLPSREEALSRLAAVLQAPVQQLATALAGPVRNLAVVLRELSQQKHA